MPVGFDDMLDGWVNIDARERALGVEEATPILIDPAGRIDPRLATFFRRSRFAFLAEGTRRSYVKDYRLFFTFLWRRGKYWNEADYDDINDYDAWRRRSADNPRPIGGAKWARELAAFRLLFDWAVVSGAVERSPVATHTVRRRDDTVVEVAANRPKDVRVANVRWVTPRTYRLWRDIGLRGYSGDGLPEPGWRGRNDGRNAAFADLLFDSGLRLREGGCLLTVEVPVPMIGQVYCEGSVAAAIAKRRERSFYVPASTLSAIAGYIATTRRGAIGRAQRAGRYEQVAGKLIVTTAAAGQRRLAWEDGLGRRGEFPVTALDERQRRRLFVQGDEGLEPLQLWLTDGGLPMDYRSWDAVFAAANARCLRLGKPISITPHSCRHSFALKMLVTLQRGLDSRYGLDKDYASVAPIFPAGWVTLIYNGDGGTGHAKYQPAPFNASDDVIVLEPLSLDATEDALLVLVTILTRQGVSKFNFGYKLTLDRLLRQRIMVPVTLDKKGGQAVDWAGMAAYGRALRVRAERALDRDQEIVAS